MKRLLLTFFALFILLCIVSCDNGEVAGITPASVVILKTGKSDCIVINTGSRILMIDTGEEENLPTIFAYMNEKQYSKIDTLIITHYDKDHIGGAERIISTYGVKTVIESKRKDDTSAYIGYHNAIIDAGATLMKLTEDYAFSHDSCDFEIFVPRKNKYTSKNDNNSSLMISMKCGEKRLLFCGDAEGERVAEIVKENTFTYDFVKLPYHGNYIDGYEGFLDSIKPTYAGITCSKKKPADERTLGLLSRKGIAVYETRNGKISIEINDTGLVITQ